MLSYILEPQQDTYFAKRRIIFFDPPAVAFAFLAVVWNAFW